MYYKTEGMSAQLQLATQYTAVMMVINDHDDDDDDDIDDGLLG